MSEILAPAGGKNSAYAAINAGADALYLGLDRFSARSSAENFDGESFNEICRYARAFGVKVYVALNTAVKNSEVEDFVKSAVEAWNGGADALIIQDLFLGEYLKKLYPEIKLHLSTQAGTCNTFGARLAKEKGFDRVILARETKLSDIAEITKIIETEVFVQGALCTCFSGQCYMSSFAGGNSGNRGKCKQPCRKLYSLDRTGFEDRAYRLSLSDLCVGEDVQKLIDAGVTSFKIEGRMRRPEYVSAAVSYYRSIIDGNDFDISSLKRTYNRGNYTKGLAFGQDKSFISSAVQGHIGEFAGIIKVINSKYICQSRLKFRRGDGFKILRDGKETGGGIFGGEVAGGFIVSTRDRLKNGDKVFVTTDTVLNERLLSGKRSIPVDLKISLFAGQTPRAVINGVEIAGEGTAEAATNRPLTVADIVRCFEKVDGYPFSPFCTVETDGVFMPSSALNAFRRKVYAQFCEIISANRNPRLDYKIQPNLQSKRQRTVNTKTAVIKTNLNGADVDIGILKPDDYNSDFNSLINGFSGEKFLYLPPYMTDGEVESIVNKLSAFDGVYCDNYYGISVAEKSGKKFFAGTGFNLMNGVSLSYCKADYVCLSKELTVKEAEELFGGNTFYHSGGNVKVMDLIYCPFEKKCASCDKRVEYTLTDGDGRKFPLRRYKTGDCRFEVYNCADLEETQVATGALNDKTLKAKISSRTRGHTVNGIY